MKSKLFFYVKQLFFLTIFLFSFSLKAFDFREQRKEAQKIFYDSSKMGSSSGKNEFISIVNQLADSPESAQDKRDWDIFVNLLKSVEYSFYKDDSNFMNQVKPIIQTASNTDWQSVKDAAVAVGGTQTSSQEYLDLGNRIDKLISQISINFSSSNASTYLKLLQDYLVEVYGSPINKSKFSFAINSLKTKSSKAGLSNIVSQLEQLKSKAEEITPQNKIEFLQRVEQAENFKSPLEQNLFMQVAVDLTKQISQLTLDHLDSFYATLVTAYNRSDFAAQTTSLNSLADTVINHWNALADGSATQDEQTSGTESSQTSSAETGATGFEKNLIDLTKLSESITKKYDSGNWQDELKSVEEKEDFFNLANQMIQILGSAMTPEHYQNRILSTIVEEEKNEISKFKNLLNSAYYKRAFSNNLDRSKINNILNNISSVNSQMILENVSDTLNNPPVFQNEKPKILRQLDLLVRRAILEDSENKLSAQQVANLSELLQMAKYNDFSAGQDLTNIETLISKMPEVDTTAISTEPQGILEQINNQMIVISQSADESKVLGSQNVGTELEPMLKLTSTSSYRLEDKNIFIAKVLDNGMIGLINKSNNKVLEIPLIGQPKMGEASFVDENLSTTSQDKKKFIIEGTNLSLVSIKVKGTTSEYGYLTVWSDSQVRTVDPDNFSLIKTIYSDQQRFKIQVLSQFDKELLKLNELNHQDRVAQYFSLYNQLEQEEDKSAFILDINYFVDQIQKDQNNWDEFRKTDAYENIKYLVGFIKSSNYFSQQEEIINDLYEKIEMTKISGLFALSKTLDPADFFTQNQIISLRFSTPEKADVLFLRQFVDPLGVTRLKATAGGLVDRAAQFKVRFDSISKTVEFYSASTSQVLKLNPSGVSTGVDLVFGSALNTSGQESKFYVVKNDDSSLSFVNLSNKGFLTILDNGVLALTNFETLEPLKQYETSKFFKIEVTNFFQELATARNFVSASDRINSYNNLFLQAEKEQEAKSLIRELGFYILENRSILDSSEKENLKDLLELLDSKTLFSKFSIFSKSLVQVLNFAESESSFDLLPMGNRVFWFNDENFISQLNDQNSIEMNLKIKGGLNLLISSQATISPDFVPEYKFVFNPNLEHIELYKNGNYVQEFDFKLDPENFKYFSLNFDSGTISLNIDNKEIVKWTDTEYTTDKKIYFGLSSTQDATIVSDVKTKTQSISFDNQNIFDIFEKTYQSWLEELDKKVREINNTDLELLKQVELASEKKLRLLGIVKRSDLLNQIAKRVENSWYYRNDSQAKIIIERINNNLNLSPDWNDKKVILWDLYGKLKQKQSNQTITSENLSRISSLILEILESTVFESYEKSQKDEIELFIGYLRYDDTFSAYFAKLDSLYNSLLQEVVKIKAEKTENILNRISQHLSVLDKIKSMKQREIFIQDIDQTLKMILEQNKARSEFSEYSEFLSLLEQAKISGIFLDLQGSLQYLEFVLGGGKDIKEEMSSDLAALTNLNSSDFVTKLENYIESFNKIQAEGLAEYHQVVSQNIVSYLNNLRNSNTKLAEHVNRIDALIKLVSLGGSLSNIAQEMEDLLKTVDSVASKDTLIKKLETEYIYLLQSKIQAGTVTEEERAMTLSLINLIRANKWFTGTATKTKLDSLEKIASQKVSSRFVLERMNAELENLADYSQDQLENFLTKLKNLHQQVLEETYYGQTTDNDIENFNNFIKDLKSKTGEYSQDGYYYIHLKKTLPLSEGGVDFDQYVISTNYQTNFKLRIEELKNSISQIKGKTEAENFKLNFRTLLNDWKLSYILDPSQDKFRPDFQTLFELALDSFYLISIKSEIQQAQEDTNFDFDVEEKITILTPAVENVQVEQVESYIDALEQISQEWKDYKAFSFNQEVDNTSINQLISAYLENDLFDLYDEKINTIKNEVNQTLNLDSKIEILNKNIEELQQLKTNLSANQKENLVEAVTQASQVLTQSSLVGLNAGNIKKLNALIAQLISSDIFDTEQDAELQIAMNKITSAQVVAQTQTTTNVEQSLQAALAAEKKTTGGFRNYVYRGTAKNY